MGEVPYRSPGQVAASAYDLAIKTLTCMLQINHFVILNPSSNGQLQILAKEVMR